MKKLYIVLIILFVSVFLTSCINLDNYVPIEEYDRLEDKYSNLRDKYINLLSNNSVTLSENNNLKEQFNLTEEQLKKYKYLLSNLNELLSNVYYVYQGKDDGSSVWGTGFSIKYQGNYYLITAGHAIENEYGVFKNLGFRDMHDSWIYPKLLKYENDYNNRNDYAIFITNKVTNGSVVDEENDRPEYILGYNNINIIKNINGTNIEGESGSPIIDNEGEIVGILTTDIFNYYTNIDIVITAIDTIK